MIKRMMLCAALAAMTGVVGAGQPGLSGQDARRSSTTTGKTVLPAHHAPRLPARDWSLLASDEERARNARAALADLTQDAKITASDLAADDQFGYSVAIDGNTAVVGAYLNDQTAGADAGAVYVFVRDGANWNQQGAPIVPADVAADDTFGRSVAVSGDTLVVGSPFATTAAGTNSGAAYVFVRNASVWTQQQKLFDDDAGIGDGGDRFGLAVAIEGDTAIIGAPNDDTTSPTSVFNGGAAHVYTRTAGVWTKQARLQASDRADDDRFGGSVDLSGEQALVGAELDDTVNGADAGSAYVFTRSAGVWTERVGLMSSATSAAGLQFGHAVAIDGGTIAVSEHLRNGGAGAVQVLVGSGAVWSPQQLLTAGDGESNDLFGHALDLRGDAVLIGAYLVESVAGQFDRGTAYLFKRSGGVWAQSDRLNASDAANFDRFGYGVALTPGAALVGAPLDDIDANADAGSGYLFHLGTTTTTTLNTATVNIVYGQSVTLNAAVSGGTPTGNVEFRNGASVLATIPLDGSFQANTVLNLPAGSYSIVAYYLGDGNHLPSNSLAKPVNVAQATTLLDLQSSLSPSVYGQEVTFTATLTVQAPGAGIPAGSIQFFDNGVLVATRTLAAGVATYAVSNLTFNGGVAHPFTATYAGDANFTASASATVNQAITRASPTNQLTSSLNPSFAGQQITLTSTITGGIPICFVDFFYDDLSDGNPRVFIAGAAISGNAASVSWTPPATGNFAITADCGADPNQFAANGSGLTQVVVPTADVSVTKSNGTNFVQSGQSTTYSIVVSNPGGGADVDGLLVNDVLNPAYFDVGAATWSCAPAGICSPESGTGDIVNLPLDLPAGSTVTITLIVPVLLGAENGVANSATLTLPGTVGDPDLGNNSATDTDGSGLFKDSFED